MYGAKTLSTLVPVDRHGRSGWVDYQSGPITLRSRRPSNERLHHEVPDALIAVGFIMK